MIKEYMSSMGMNRRQFLSMGMKGTTPFVRPPWALDEDLFQAACTRCGDCLEVCPEDILIREGREGYPFVDFNRGACTFCRRCVDVCSTTALNQSPNHLPWQIKANVNSNCLAAGQVICTTCAEQCEAGAIRFKPLVGKVAEPSISGSTCTGCGACVALCPSQAVEVHL
ncbi:MAG: ferredoxin-type protein NapF [Mariprofundaceae bacterium]